MPSTPMSLAIFVYSIDSFVEYVPVPAIIFALSPTESLAVE